MDQNLQTIAALYKHNASERQIAAAVYDTLLEAIVRNMLPKNYRIKDEAIASLFQTSRTPVREALNILRKRGLIVADTKSGDVVRGYTVNDANDISTYAKVLRSEAASIAAKKITPEKLEEVEKMRLTDEWIAQMKAEKSPTKIYIRYLAFHELIATIADNAYLVQESKLVNEKLLMMHFYYPSVMKDEFTSNRYTFQHRDLIEALRRQDSKAAYDAILRYATHNVTRHMYIANREFE